MRGHSWILVDYIDNFMSNLIRRALLSFSTAAEAVIQLVPKPSTQKKPSYYKLPENSIPLTATVTRSDLLKHFRELCVMRQLEIQCDILYKAKKIRGFCHLYDGQVSTSLCRKQFQKEWRQPSPLMIL